MKPFEYAFYIWGAVGITLLMAYRLPMQLLFCLWLGAGIIELIAVILAKSRTQPEQQQQEEQDEQVQEATPQ